ncbi:MULTISPECIES: hypothetical protein [Methylobacterium]|jgi:hypothetical protein|nr:MULTISPECIES: hypothetical protein [Methylobacterium]GJE21669.1 hypothetical protein JHFBIEKO_2115 [Methylobacterium mesophilicum]
MSRDPDGLQAGDALGPERGSRMPDYIGGAVIGFLIVAAAVRVILAHTV